MPFRFAFAGICCVTLLIGCDGGSLQSVSGKATYKDQPMAGGTIILNPKGKEDSLTAIKPSAGIADDGTFKLMTDGKSGAPAGKYLVTFVWAGPKAAPAKSVAIKGMGGEGEDRTSRAAFLPEMYTNPKLAKVEIEIKPGESELAPIQLK